MARERIVYTAMRKFLVILFLIKFVSMDNFPSKKDLRGCEQQKYKLNG